MQASVNNSFLKRLKPSPEGQQLIWDTNMARFGVLVGATGASFIVRPYHSSSRLKIGRVGVMSLDEAREEARTILDASHKGEDVQAARQKRRGERPLRDELPEWMAERAKDPDDLAPRTYKTWESAARLYIIPALGAKKPSQITAAGISDAYKKIKSDRSVRQANNSLTILSSFFNSRYPGRNPVHDMRHDKDLKKALKRDGRRKEALWQEQVKAVWRETYKVQSQDAADVIRLLILTGCRQGEIRALRWDSVDFLSRKIRLTNTMTKERQEKNIDLSEPAMKLLQRRRAKADETSPFVFPSDSEHGYIQNVYATWKRIRDAAGISPAIHIHDLRATYATLLSLAGIDDKVIGESMGHADPKTTDHYKRIADTMKQDIAQRSPQVFGIFDEEEGVA